MRILIDCGAFTMWKAGKPPIKVDDYCDFIKRVPFHAWNYFALDVIGEPKGTKKNLYQMLDKGLKPVPIFTRGEKLVQLEEFFKVSKLVAIGGLVHTMYNRGFVKWLMQRGLKGRRIHWLGFTETKFLKFYKPYSCDCSSWSTGTRWGGLPIYLNCGRITYWLSMRKKQRVHLSAERKAEFWNVFLKKLDFVDEREFHDYSIFDNEPLLRKIGTHAFMKHSIDVERYLGTYFFNVVASPEDLEQTMQAWEYWQ